MNKSKRCLICKKKSIWSDSNNELFFCEKHNKRFEDFLEGKLPNNSSWKKIRKELVAKFLKKEINNFKRVKKYQLNKKNKNEKNKKRKKEK
jgi:hypothetical protein